MEHQDRMSQKAKEIKEMFTPFDDNILKDNDGWFPDSELGDSLFVLNGDYERKNVDGKLYWRRKPRN